MITYVLVRTSVPLPHVLLAAPARTDLPDAADWLVDAAHSPTICLLDDAEFERATLYEGAVVLTSTIGKDKESRKEVAVIFGPRDEWPSEFADFRRCFEERDATRRKKKRGVTEKVWLTCNTRPEVLARFALKRLSERKTRLLEVACCELVIDKLTDPRSTHAVQVALRHAYGKADDCELTTAQKNAHDAMIAIIVKGQREHATNIQGSPECAAAALASYTCGEHAYKVTKPKWPENHSDYLVDQLRRAAKEDKHIDLRFSRVLRDICANPFRPVASDPEWQSPAVTRLAELINELRAFHRLPELAVELENAGCHEQSVLDHCRHSGSHVRGCWVVDLALGFGT